MELKLEKSDGRGNHSNHRRGPIVARVPVVCEVCGVERSYLPSHARQRTGRFCSQACSAKAAIKDGSVLTVLCAQCGKAVHRRADHLAASKTGAYCSKECFADARRVDGARWRDPEAISEYMRDYRLANRESLNEKVQARKKLNRDRANEVQRARRARAKRSDLTAQDWNEIKAEWLFMCLACGQVEPTIRLEPDHVEPLARGGRHSKDNIQPLCRSCNAAKGAKFIDYRINVRES